MNYKAAAIGINDSVLPFLLVGIDTYEPLFGDDLFRQVAQLVREGYCLLFISEECLDKTPALLQSYDKDPHVTVIPVPGIAGSGGIGRQRISQMVEKALGKNIL